MSKQPILLTVFIHEDLKNENEDVLYIDHLDWVVDRIASITGRIMDVDFAWPSAAPSVCTYHYKNEDEDKSLTDLGPLVDTFKTNNAQHIKYDVNLHKFLLLTRDKINKNTLGIAYLPGELAIASITGGTAAHEIGHLFSANHEHADDTYNGLPHKSIMSPDAPAEYRFSNKNQENIRDYLDQFD